MALHAPAYQHVSRHRVFYLRWPLPKALHPQGRPSTVKVSLGTCDKRQALQLARSLGYSAERLIAKGTASGMKYEDKQLKTGASKRLVPIHSRLIELGLLDHVEAMRKKGAKKLFPDFSYCPKNGWGRSLGRWFNDTFLDKIGLTEKGLVFHSLRHTVVTFLMQANIFVTQIAGIALPGALIVGAGLGSPHRLVRRQIESAEDRITYDS